MPQTLPQNPQLLWLVCVFTSQPSATWALQSEKPELQKPIWHCDPLQVGDPFAVEHTLLQLPQLLTSVAIVTSQPSPGLPLQFDWPGPHTHCPALHTVVPTQSLLPAHPPPSAHAGQSLPPQSTPVSPPSWNPFEQLGAHTLPAQLSEQHSEALEHD